jgi:hypothetical protein
LNPRELQTASRIAREEASAVSYQPSSLSIQHSLPYQKPTADGR